jgi:hypothetical protein
LGAILKPISFNQGTKFFFRFATILRFTKIADFLVSGLFHFISPKLATEFAAQVQHRGSADSGQQLFTRLKP